MEKNTLPLLKSSDRIAWRAVPKEPERKPWAKNLVAGALAALVTLAYSVSYAALIFPGKLTAYLGFGVTCALVSAAILGAWSALFSPLPFAIAGPDSNSSAFLAMIVGGLVVSMNQRAPGVPILSTLMATIALGSWVSGVLLFSLGRFKLGSLVRFIPYPVVGGFLAGTGWLITLGAFTVMLGNPPTLSSLPSLIKTSSLVHWLPGVLVAFTMLLVLRRTQHFLWMPLMLVSFVILFYFVLLGSGWSLHQGRQAGLLFEPMPRQGLSQVWLGFHLKDIQWMIVLDQMASILAMTAVVVVTILLNATGLELATSRDVDLDQELRASGSANMVTSLVGGMVGYVSISRSLLNFMAGASGRTAGLVSAGICGAFVYFGSDLLKFLPKPILGGLLLYLGLSLLVEWLVDSWKRLSTFDYLLILVIVVVVAFRGFLAGVGVGVVMACLIFAFRYSRIEVIKHEFTGLERQSNVERSMNTQAVLQEYASQIYVLVLQGYIFFGTATQLLEHVSRRLSTTSSQRPIRFLILDFRLVNDIDSSAILSFKKMVRQAQSHGVVLIYTHLSNDMQKLLQDNQCLLENGPTKVFHDLDYSIEWCEETILEEIDPTRTLQVSLFHMLRGQFPSAEVTEQLMTYLEPIHLRKGDFLFKENDPSNGLYFVELGRITVLITLPNGRLKRLRTMGSGTVVGEMGLYRDSRRSAAVRAEYDSRLYRLSQSTMDRILIEEPILASHIHHFIVRMLSNRLAHANRELGALHH